MSKHLNNNKLDSSKRFDFLDKLDIDQDVKERLSINLLRTLSGSNEIYVTPIAKEHGADKLLSGWDKVFHANKSVMNNALINIEGEQKLKYGPRSIAKPWSERREGTLAYFERNNVDYSALTCLPDNLRDKGILRPLSLGNASKFLKNSTNSGLPFYTKKGKIKERLLERFDSYLSRKDPCVLFTRTTEQRKTRDVWGYPIADSLNDMRYSRPLFEYQRKLHWRSALRGPEQVNKKMTKIITEGRRLGLALLSQDFTAYDRSIKPEGQRKITDYRKYLFSPKCSDELDMITERKVNIGLVTPEGVLSDEHALPSGANDTNEDGSIFQMAIAKESGCLVGDLFDIQGDDGALAIVGEKVNTLSKCYDKYRVEMNVDKAGVNSDKIVYLQNLFDIHYVNGGEIKGIYPTYRALCRIAYQERWSDFEDYGIKGRDYYAIRSLTILENCKYHPLFKELVKYVWKLDKYGLKPSHQGISDYVRMMSEKSGIEGMIINQHGDDLKGIRNFESYKLVKGMS